jgi:hypothetical protein
LCAFAPSLLISPLSLICITLYLIP